MHFRHYSKKGFSETLTKHPGYTLIEVVVASAIVAILSGLVFFIATNMTQAWKAASGQLSTGTAGELALDILASDLEAAVIGPRDRIWMELVVESGIGDGNLQLEGAVHLMFFTRQAGGLSAVSYRLGYRDPFRNEREGAHAQFGLYRALMDVENTFRHALSDDRSHQLKARVWDQVGAIPWENLSGDGRQISPRDWSLDTANLLVSSVLTFEAALNFRDEQGEQKRLPIGVGPGSARTLAVGPDLKIDGVSYPYGELLSMDITLAVLTREGVRQLEGQLHYGEGAEATSAKITSLLRSHGIILSRRIAFLSSS